MGWPKQKVALQSHAHFWQVTTGRSELAATLCVLSKITWSDTLADRDRDQQLPKMLWLPRHAEHGERKKSRTDEK